MIAVALVTCALVAAATPATFDTVDYGMGAERDVAVDGVRVRVHEGGLPKETAPTVVLLHPFGLTMMVWRDVLPELERRFHVVAYDAPGHGKSDRIWRRITLDLLARNVLGLLDALGIEHAMLMGNSMGGGAALVAALAAPDRVDRVVLVGSVGVDFHAWFALPLPMMSASDIASAPDFTFVLAMALATVKRPPLVEDIEHNLLATRADVLAQRGCLGWYAITSDMLKAGRTMPLATVRTPVLLVHGAQDHIVPSSHAEELHAGIAGSQLVLLEGIGHLPESEDPQGFLAVVLPFLATSVPP